VPKKIFVIIAVIALAAVAALVISRRSNAVKGEVKVSGTIEATTAELSFKVGGRLLKRLVDEGMQVTVGQTVALLEDVLISLQTLSPVVSVPEDIRLRARSALDRMLAVPRD
jgi:multidrug efflux pump subunit AcrA (membrane-fusion protein)